MIDPCSQWLKIFAIFLTGTPFVTFLVSVFLHVAQKRRENIWWENAKLHEENKRLKDELEKCTNSK
jgi:hypothetical protein